MGQQEMGYHPTLGLSSWQPLPLPSVSSWPWGAGPSAPPLVLFWQNLRAKASDAQAGCHGNEVLRGLGAQGTSKCVVEYVQKGQSLSVSRSSDVAGR